MKCDEFVRLAEELALTDPNVEVTGEAAAHLKSCSTCRQAYFELREAWALLPAALEPQPVNPNLEETILRRVNESPRPLDELDSKTTRVGKYALAASVLFALVSATIHFTYGGGQQHNDVAQLKEFARQMDKLEQLETTFATPDVHYVSLNSPNRRTQGQAYLLFDFLANEGHFFARDLHEASTDPVRLWLLNEKGVGLATAPITMNQNAISTAVIPLPKDGAMIRSIVVSVDQDANASTPSAHVLLRAEIDSR